jgi:hypothetical protein
LIVELQSIKFALRALSGKNPRKIITPSSCAAEGEGVNELRNLLEICGFGVQTLESRVLLRESTPDQTFNFEFHFHDQDEKASYDPLQEFLKSKSIFVVNVTTGEGMLGGLVFREEIWTLKQTFQKQRVFKYIVSGRTDFVRLKGNNNIIGRSNIQYYIEVKKEKIAEADFREAFVQLIGANAANSFHSPPVFLTNLNLDHYVLFITFDEDQGNYYLNNWQFRSFNDAIQYLEASTSTMRSCTAHFLVKNTPFSTPPKRRDYRSDDEDESEEEGDSKVQIQLVDVDDATEFAEYFESKLQVEEIKDRA